MAAPTLSEVQAAHDKAVATLNAARKESDRLAIVSRDSGTDADHWVWKKAEKAAEIAAAREATTSRRLARAVKAAAKAEADALLLQGVLEVRGLAGYDLPLSGKTLQALEKKALNHIAKNVWYVGQSFTMRIDGQEPVTWRVLKNPDPEGVPYLDRVETPAPEPAALTKALDLLSAHPLATNPPPPLVVFDLDGTLAIVDHRKHHLDRRPKDWRGFYAACDKDTPNVPVVKTLQLLRAAGVEVWIFSARSDEVREKTMAWIRTHVGEFRDEHVRMREALDHQCDDQLKERWLNEMLDVDRQRLMCIYDDRDQVVAMWRRNGVACFQVAPGAF